MALMFDDNLLHCDKCNNDTFYEQEIYSLDEHVDKMGEVRYVKVQPRKVIICSKCKNIVKTSKDSLIKDI